MVKLGILLLVLGIAFAFLPFVQAFAEIPQEALNVITPLFCETGETLVEQRADFGGGVSIGAGMFCQKASGAARDVSAQFTTLTVLGSAVPILLGVLFIILGIFRNASNRAQQPFAPVPPGYDSGWSKTIGQVPGYGTYPQQTPPPAGYSPAIDPLTGRPIGQPSAAPTPSEKFYFETQMNLSKPDAAAPSNRYDFTPDPTIMGGISRGDVQSASRGGGYDYTSEPTMVTGVSREDLEARARAEMPTQTELSPPSKSAAAETAKSAAAPDDGENKDLVAKLRQLKEALDHGLITAEEYEQKKDQLLSEL